MTAEGVKQGPRPVEVALNPRREEMPDLGGLAPGARLARNFHAGLPGYAPTTLVELPALARRLGLWAVFVKDESRRFGLEAFKGLGSAWAVARLLGERRGLAPATLDFASLRAARPRLGELTFVTATDGNHGRGLAWAARLLGHRARVFMPAGASAARVAAIRAQGAECTVTELAYDDAVRHAAAHARETDGILVQDTAWEGYEKIPTWIMEGYGTLALEAAEQLAGMGVSGPTHVFVQAGVGSFAAAMVACLGTALKTQGMPQPRFVSVEPHAADCVFRSIAAGDGRPRICPGSLETLMAGLSCGEVSSLAWPVLSAGLHAACACPDELARLGMRLLARPFGEDPALVSGESGAVGAGLLHWLMRPEESPETSGNAARGREALGLGPGARVLIISTEGATDPAVWEAVTGLS
ncbi:diaminopropionate ammonia-lyase [Desulfovibrio sp.]|uniref:diaminopropionate ammonia-lyase n=1 Tax=Desulfovibrio sp. TaxID=885 RepID=UPI0025BAEC1B|nr:diaminopropionate ammonia-lyase [Desulfovibrio sp.]